MEKYYKILGLSPSASEEKVDTQYKKLVKNYNPDNFMDGAQKKHAEKSLAEITDAYQKIKEHLHPRSSAATATQTASAYAQQKIEHVDAEIVEDNDIYTHKNSQGMYDYVRRMIQNGEYDTAMMRLNANANVNDAEWQFLMGSAMYYNGFVSDAYPHFKRAAEMAPNNREYTAMYSRLNNSRKGNVYSSPYNRKDLDDMNELCDDACDVIKCLICISCCRGR